MSCVHGLSPAPTILAPKLLAFVTSIINKRSKLSVPNCSSRHRERLDLHLVRIHLVIEDERPVGQTPEEQPAAGHPGVTQIFAAGTRILRVIHGRDARATV